MRCNILPFRCYAILTHRDFDILHPILIHVVGKTAVMGKTDLTHIEQIGNQSFRTATKTAHAFAELHQTEISPRGW